MIIKRTPKAHNGLQNEIFELDFFNVHCTNNPSGWEYTNLPFSALFLLQTSTQRYHNINHPRGKE